MANEVVIKIRADDQASVALTGIQQKAGGLGTALGGALRVGAIAGAGAVGALGVAAFKTGRDFDSAFDTIRIGTGATGDALEDLKTQFRDAFSRVPTDMASASTAIADLNTRTGATGDTLEDMAVQMLNMTRLTGGDLSANIASVTRLMGDWGVSNDRAAGLMDSLFVVSQSTGIGIDKLASSLVQFGAPLRQMGFTLDEAASLLGKFEREGVNAELVMGSMRIALGKMAREGEPTVETFQRVVEEIKNAGDASSANAIALELFGARAGPDMAAAIREGRFEIAELMGDLETSQGTIAQTATDTDDFGEKWIVLKNKLLVEVEPALTAMIDKLTELTDWLIITGIPALEEWVEENRETFETIGEIIRVFTEIAIPILTGFIDFTIARFTHMTETLTGIFNVFKGIFTGDFGLFFDGLKQTAQAQLDFIKDIFSTAWDTINTLTKGKMDEAAGAVLTALGNLAYGLSAIFGPIVNIFRGYANQIIGVFNGIIGAVETAVNAVARGINAIPDINLPFGLGSIGVPWVPSVSMGRIPSLQHGGEVTKTGLAVVHEGETFSGVGGGMGTVNITINALDGESVRRVVPDIARELQRFMRTQGAVGMV